jgi:alpha-L-fucosidase
LHTTTAWDATWESLDSRPLPSWYEDAKFGIFVHWGVFSVPSIVSEWFQSYWQNHWGNPAIQDFVKRTERSNFAYMDYAHRFTADLYKPENWVDLFTRAGAQYVVYTSKHHDGYCNWNTSTRVPTAWNWNAMDVGPRRDLLGEFARALKNSTSHHTNERIKLGIYHSLYEWYNPLYISDKRNNYTTDDFVRQKTGLELYDLVKTYEPEVFWSDGEWEVHSDYWKSTDFLAWYATNSTVAKTAVWNDRWGQETLCKHGGFLTCTDRYEPTDLQPKKWEDALTIDTTSWSYNRNASYADYLTTKQIVDTIIRVVSRNGNVLLNVGPAADGTIHPIFVDRLLGVGDWLMVNGRAIYKSRPWTVCQFENATNVYYTRNDKTLYVHVTQWPSKSILHLDCPVTSSKTRIQMLGLNSTEAINWTAKTSFSGIQIHLPLLTPDIIPCQHAWVLEMTGIVNV